MRHFLITFSFLLFCSFAQADNLNFKFSRPSEDNLDYSIHNKIIKLLDLSAPKSAVRINIYFLSHSPVAQAIVDARRRGVDVKVIIDKATESFDAFKILSRLRSPDLCSEGKCLVSCGKSIRNFKLSGACLGKRNNHNKFFLFEKLLDGRKHVVIQSSSNMDRGSKWNDLIEIGENEKLYQAYLNYWNTSRQKRKMRSYTRTHRDQKVEAYFFPRAHGDPIIDILNRVNCSQGGSIRVAQSRFTRGRSKVAKKLIELKGQGCELSLLVAHNPKRGSPGLNILSILDGHMKIVEGLHSKFFTIDAILDGKKQKFIMTGSHNLNKNSLRNNDESLLLVKDSTAYQTYFHHWNVLDKNLDSKIH